MKILKKVLLLCLLLLLMLVACACGSIKKEDAIKQDILSEYAFLEGYELINTRVDIDKRLTEGKDDKVWVVFSGENDRFSYSASLQMHYLEYNDGWRLEDCSMDGETITPKEAPDEEFIKETIFGYGYGDITSFEMSWEDGDYYNYIFKVEQETTDGFLNVIRTGNISAEFGAYSGWYVSEPVFDDEKFSIRDAEKYVGSYDSTYTYTWYGADRTCVFHIDVKEISGDKVDFAVTIEYPNDEIQESWTERTTMKDPADVTPEFYLTGQAGVYELRVPIAEQSTFWGGTFKLVFRSVVEGSGYDNETGVWLYSNGLASDESYYECIKR